MAGGTQSILNSIEDRLFAIERREAGTDQLPNVLKELEEIVLFPGTDTPDRERASILSVKWALRQGDPKLALRIAEEYSTNVRLSPRSLEWMDYFKGVCFSQLGRSEEALTLLQAVLRRAEQRSDDELSALASCNLGAIHSNVGEYARAITYLAETLRLTEDSQTLIPTRAQAQLVLSQIYLERKELGTALEYARDSVEAFRSLRRRNSEISACLLQCSILIESKDLLAARDILDTLQAIELDSFSAHQLVSFQLLEGKYAVEIDDAGQAKSYFQSAIRNSKESGNERLAVNALQHLVEMHLKQHEPREATELLKRIRDTNLDGYSEIVYNELMARLAVLKGRFEDALSFREVQWKLEREQYEIQADDRLNRIRVASELAREQLTATHFRERSEFYAKELSQRTSYLVQQNDYISALIDHINAIAHTRPESLDILKDIRRRLRGLPAASFNWDDYLRLFDEIHPNALAALKRTYPELSPTESRVCSLLLAKLSTVDIAKLLAVSERTIENHRYRLRKKLGIPAESDLAEFLEGVVRSAGT